MHTLLLFMINLNINFHILFYQIPHLLKNDIFIYLIYMLIPQFHAQNEDVFLKIFLLFYYPKIIIPIFLNFQILHQKMIIIL